MSPKEQATPYPIRMPEDLREQLTKAAEDGKRSLHAEILARLQFSFALSPDAHQVLSTNARLNGEVADLRELVATQRRALAAQERNLILLATQIVDIANALPAKQRQEPTVRRAVEFAHTLEVRDRLIALAASPNLEPMPEMGSESREDRAWAVLEPDKPARKPRKKR